MLATHKTTLYLPERDVRRLKRLANERGSTLTSLIRQAVERFLTSSVSGDAPSKGFLKARGRFRNRRHFGDSVAFQRELRAESERG